MCAQSMAKSFTKGFLQHGYSTQRQSSSIQNYPDRMRYAKRLLKKKKGSTLRRLCYFRRKRRHRSKNMTVSARFKAWKPCQPGIDVTEALSGNSKAAPTQYDSIYCSGLVSFFNVMIAVRQIVLERHLTRVME